MAKILDIFLYVILAITIPAVLLQNTTLIIIAVILGFIYGIITLLRIFLKTTAGNTPVWIEDSAVTKSVENNTRDSDDPFGRELRVPYAKYLEERKDFLDYLNVLDPDNEYVTEGRTLTVREMTEEIQNQTTFGKEYIQQLIEQDTDYE